MLALITAALAAATVAPTAAMPAQCANNNPNTYNFMIGGNPAKIISDGTLEAPASLAFIDDPSIVDRIVKDYFIDPANLNPGVNIVYLELDGEKILFDTGNGEAGGGNLNLELAANGIARDDITAVFLTHGHGDHLGGLTLQDGSLAFPNAKVYVSQTEWDYWRADEVDTLNSQLPEEALMMQADNAKMVFAAIEDNVELFELGTEVVPGISSISTPWHLPGHSAYKLTFGNDTFVVAGDSLLHYVAVENPWLRVRFDTMPETGPAGRYELLDEIVAMGATVSPMHSPFPALGNVRTVTGAAFRWVDAPYVGDKGIVAACSATGGYGGGGGYGYGGGYGN